MMMMMTMSAVATHSNDNYDGGITAGNHGKISDGG